MMCSVAKHLGCGQNAQKVLGKKTRLRLVPVPLHFFRALPAACVLYNRTDQKISHGECFSNVLSRKAVR